MDRRMMLVRAFQGMSLALVGTLLGPGAVSILSPVFESRGPRWRPIGPLEVFPVGRVTQAIVDLDRDDWATTLRERGVYVWRRTPQELVVFSRSCTDLGCPVTWDPGSAWFYCPCHGGIFSREGERRAGPPNRPLYRYHWRVQQGVVEIDLLSVPPVT